MEIFLIALELKAVNLVLWFSTPTIILRLCLLVKRGNKQELTHI